MEETEPLPAEFSPSQNYPDPFNAQMAIDYALPKGGPIKLQVFDIMWRAVATLVEGIMPAGYHQLTWDDREFPSEIYLARLEAGSFSGASKMLLIK